LEVDDLHLPHPGEFFGKFLQRFLQVLVQFNSLISSSWIFLLKKNGIGFFLNIFT